MIRFGQNQNLASSKAFYLLRLMGKYRQTFHDACLNGTPKQFVVISD